MPMDWVVAIRTAIKSRSQKACRFRAGFADSLVFGSLQRGTACEVAQTDRPLTAQIGDKTGQQDVRRNATLRLLPLQQRGNFAIKCAVTKSAEQQIQPALGKGPVEFLHLIIARFVDK